MSAEILKKLNPRNHRKVAKASHSRLAARATGDNWLPPPQPGKQTEMYYHEADVLFVGGAAGSSKTFFLLLDSAKPEYIRTEGYNCVIFRRSYPQLTNPGGIVDESKNLYRKIGGRYTSKPPTWRWDAFNSQVAFRPLQYEDTVYEYQGAQFARIGFDELTHFCLTPDHDVLTENGWKAISSVKDGERVASYTSDGIVEYQPANLVSFEYEGEMLDVNCKRFSMRMTPNHRMVVEKQLPNNKKSDGHRHSGWRFRQASDCFGKNIAVPRTGVFEGTEVEFYDLDLVEGRGLGKNANTVDRVRMDDYLRFLGWYFSEGCAFEAINKNAVTGRGSPVVSIRQTKAQHLGDIRSAFDAIGFKWNETKCGQFIICSRQLYEDLIRYGKGAKEKRVPRWLFRLGTRQIRIFLDAFARGDGHINKSDGITIGLCNKGLIDDLQELYFLCGMVGKTHHLVTQTGFDVYTLNVTPKTERSYIGSKNWSKTHYAGKIYCLQVEKNGNFLARRDGGYYWTGNSADQFFYLLSRNRSACGVPSQVRATMNPDADSWVSSFIQWWWDAETGYPIPERSGVIRYFVRFDDRTFWADTKEQLIKEHYDRLEAIVTESQGIVTFDDLVKSFSFIAATIYDNPALLRVNPQYLSNLNSLGEVERQRLLFGNWKIRHDSGLVFDSNWFTIIDYDEMPREPLIKIRFWDLAATGREDAGAGSCYTAGCLMGMVGTNVYILDLQVLQVKGGDVINPIKGCAMVDGLSTKIRFELEGGASGKIVEESFTNELQKLDHRYDIRAIKPDKSKLQRALPLATQARLGYVYLIRGDWNGEFLSAAESFDGLRRPRVNDIIDSATGAFEQVSHPQNSVMLTGEDSFVVGYDSPQASSFTYL